VNVRFIYRQSKFLLSVFLLANFIFASTERTFGTDKKVEMVAAYVTASDLDHSIATSDVEIGYVVYWDDPIKEEIRVAFTHSGDSSSGSGVTSEGAAGLNICSPSDGNTVYGFFRDGIVSIDFKLQRLNPVAATDIKSDLSYLGRFEISELKDSSHPGKITFVVPPNTGSGPKNPCSLPAEGS
jgi:hypothetical protein